MGAFEKCRGAEGVDGWSARESKVLRVVAPFMISELYEVWVSTAEYLVRRRGNPGRELLEKPVTWRVVGPPRKDENESRPISVTPAAVRIWLSALAAALPGAAEKK
eukprot:3627150-Pyramimonas_sp.AAC.1